MGVSGPRKPHVGLCPPAPLLRPPLGGNSLSRRTPGTPPLPEIPPGPFPHATEYYKPKRPIGASEYPSVTAFLKAQSDKTATVIVVLFEDIYETCLGDGEFHYFQDVFLTREDAQSYVDRAPAEGERFHLRTMSIRLDSEALGFPDFHVELFDHYTPEDVLKALEARLRV